MLLLITDTSGKHGSVALVRAHDGTNEVDLIEEVPLAGGTFSAQLVPQIATLLAKHGFSKTDIGAFIVVSGPGSFTGLRVGLAAIKALAEILEKPIVPVSLLEVIALAGQVQGRVLAALDAGRSEVYAGEYEIAEETARFVGEQLVSKDECVLAGKNIALITPDEVLDTWARSNDISSTFIARPNAERIAQLGWRKLRTNETVSPAELEANYIRRSDAEIFAKTILT
jgi:tRNA threonylcarbamoyladenosine biosynthesis protein TsaB